jgi:hypothetical protein
MAIWGVRASAISSIVFPVSVSLALAGEGLEAPDDNIAVKRIKLGAPGWPARLLSRHESRPEAAEGIENQLATVRDIERGIGNERDRLHAEPCRT